MEVSTSPKKKSLNLTAPKGEIIVNHREYISSSLNALYMQLKGFKKNITSSMISVKA